MTVLPLFHSCVEQSGELCCCTTCCDFLFFCPFFVFVKAGALLCSNSHFLFSLGFFVDAYYVLSLILSFICICSIYKYIYYIFHIFLYLCLFAILGVVWLCNRSLTSNYVDTENISYIHMYNEKTLPRALHSPSPPRDPFFSERVSHFFSSRTGRLTCELQSSSWKRALQVDDVTQQHTCLSRLLASALGRQKL